MNSYFILSCARSGSTSLARILNLATNSICQSEPMPNLCIETRLAMEGKLSETQTDEVLERSVMTRVEHFRNDYEVYGEKNVTFGPFIEQMYKKLNCKFIFLKRDGRDVVSSMLNWHNHKFGDFYKEACDFGDVSPEALAAAKELLAYQDISDFSRPRPLVYDDLYLKWNSLSRFEMCSYYWSYINNLYLENLSKISKNNYIELDYTKVLPEDVSKVLDFLGLKGVEEQTIQLMLNEKINSLENREDKKGKFPSWVKWSDQLRRKFEKFAKDTMYELGYFIDGATNWKPVDFGKYWKEQKKADNDWFEWMYHSRKYAHDDLIQFVKNNDIKSVADFGCGTSVGYSQAFSDIQYVGVDISEGNIEWCRQNRYNLKHKYIARDFIQYPLDEKVDLVFSSGTIDNAYDVRAFIKAMVDSSRKCISFTLYRGWFLDLDDVIYNYNLDGYFYNDIGVRFLQRYLKELGCKEISITPLETGKNDIIYETRVVAYV
ncbi:methyltransferase domain-containing protein [Francisella sp. 19X1-34]|uniref:methyltransferase domain-containing protein n=1 Tax=Francisella sp. 19X1-34 TaxID=3087177 RepID=UPI002E350DF8|nr:methyltransferase domain-containing protein [Francisella sp. 19X1-34]MED7787550.1 methyltransferase domain-containing protein [Francisella sp. 19X1-34]